MTRETATNQTAHLTEVHSAEDKAGNHYLGQFIPLHYHHNMLLDDNRMANFKAAIQQAVFEGAKVLELGGGTGVLSCLAAAKADKVWCVEFNPELVAESRRILALNRDGHKVEVIHADAFDYLPPEPVDIVICEMIHVAMLREKQVEMIESFKQRYRQRFGDKLPIFMPEAVIMAVQPLDQHYDFYGYYAPIIQFQRPQVINQHSIELAEPVVYSTLDFTEHTSQRIEYIGNIEISQNGRINALRFITKNILAVIEQSGSTIDWLNDYLVLPLAKAIDVKAGDTIQLSFNYRTGAPIRSLENTLRAKLL